MEHIRYRNLIAAVRSITAVVLAIAVVILPHAAFAEKANVFFIHGANVSEQDARVWAAVMFKGLYQAGANMEFYPVAWQSDIGPSYNYHPPANFQCNTRCIVNAGNAFFETSDIIAHSDYGWETLSGG